MNHWAGLPRLRTMPRPLAERAQRASASRRRHATGIQAGAPRTTTSAKTMPSVSKKVPVAQKRP
eukprot:4694486-Alexandrium_andersonii.AAC.1